jgi:hypothetical protein
LVCLGGEEDAVDSGLSATCAGVCGLNQYQARTWRAWHAHTTFAMIAHALLALARVPGTEKGVTRSARRSASR